MTHQRWLSEAVGFECVFSYTVSSSVSAAASPPSTVCRDTGPLSLVPGLARAALSAAPLSILVIERWAFGRTVLVGSHIVPHMLRVTLWSQEDPPRGKERRRQGTWCPRYLKVRGFPLRGHQTEVHLVPGWDGSRRPSSGALSLASTYLTSWCLLSPLRTEVPGSLLGWSGDTQAAPKGDGVWGMGGEGTGGAWGGARLEVLSSCSLRLLWRSSLWEASWIKAQSWRRTSQILKSSTGGPSTMHLCRSSRGRWEQSRLLRVEGLETEEGKW